MIVIDGISRNKNEETAGLPKQLFIEDTTDKGENNNNNNDDDSINFNLVGREERFRLGGDYDNEIELSQIDHHSTTSSSNSSAVLDENAPDWLIRVRQYQKQLLKKYEKGK